MVCAEFWRRTGTSSTKNRGICSGSRGIVCRLGREEVQIGRAKVASEAGGCRVQVSNQTGEQGSGHEHVRQGACWVSKGRGSYWIQGHCGVPSGPQVCDSWKSETKERTGTRMPTVKAAWRQSQIETLESCWEFMACVFASSCLMMISMFVHSLYDGMGRHYTMKAHVVTHTLVLSALK